MIAGVILIVITANVAYMWWMKQRPQETPRSSPSSPDISGGVPIQRARIDEFINTVQKETLEQSIENLNLHEWNVLRSGLKSYVSHPDPHLTDRCLANRRLARIFEDFSKMPEAERTRRSTALFDKTLADFRNGVDLALTRWENDDPPKSVTELYGEKRSLAAYSWALAGGQLVCAQFCPLDTALDSYARTNQLLDEIRARVENAGEKLKAPYFEVSSLRDPSLFDINLARILFERHFNVKDMDTLMPADMKAHATAFYAWNAHTNEQDFTHQRRGVPPDSDRILRVFSFYSEWHLDGQRSSEVRAAVIARCWDELKHLASNKNEVQK